MLLEELEDRDLSDLKLFEGCEFLRREAKKLDPLKICHKMLLSVDEHEAFNKLRKEIFK